MANKRDFRIEFNTELLWLQRYFKGTLKKMIAELREELHSQKYNQFGDVKVQTTKKVTSQALHNIIVEEGSTRLQMLLTWERVIKEQVDKTDKNLLAVIKAVFVHGTMNVSGAGTRYLYYSKTTTYKILYTWFEQLTLAYFKAR